MAMSLAGRFSFVRGAECRDRQIRIRQSSDLAARSCDAWEPEGERRGRESTAEFWDYGRIWIAAQIALRRSPTGGLARR